jgi:hypothetical protein
MVVVRSGLDKVVFTVLDKRRLKHSSNPTVKLKYSDRLTKLKFQDRYAYCILFEKYPHRTWKYQGQEKSTYGVEYFMRIDGLRQMRVMVNCMRMFNIRHDLKPTPKALFDDNVVDPDVTFVMASFVRIVQELIQEFIDDYIELRKTVFDEEIIRENVEVFTHSMEVVREGLGLHTSDIGYTFQDFPLCDSVKVYHNTTNTHYFNTSGSRQLKFYNKALGVLRMEATFHNYTKDIVLNWQGHPATIAQSIEMEVDELLADMQIPMNWYEAFQIRTVNLIWLIANALDIRREGSDELDIDLMKVLLTSKSINSTRENRNTIRKLVRKRLVKGQMRGKYVPTERLAMMQRLYNIVRRTEGKIIDTSTGGTTEP